MSHYNYYGGLGYGYKGFGGLGYGSGSGRASFRRLGHGCDHGGYGYASGYRSHRCGYCRPLGCGEYEFSSFY